MRGNFEYVALRLIRRFLFNDRLLSIPWVRACLPHYRTNWNEVDPTPIARRYADFLQERPMPKGARWLEIGVGATNSTGYALAAEMMRRGARDFRLLLMEPFVPLAEAADAAILARVATASELPARQLADCVERIESLAGLSPQSIEAVLSSSVLEHVAEPEALFVDLTRLVRPGSRSLHFVDYRDHFFKYPYHFLKFSRWTWDRFLNPGDLPRWRLSDHVRLFERLGWSLEVREPTSDPAAFAAIEPALSPDFDRQDPLLAVMTAILVARSPAS